MQPIRTIGIIREYHSLAPSVNGTCNTDTWAVTTADAAVRKVTYLRCANSLGHVNFLWDDQTGLPKSFAPEEVEEKTEAIFKHLLVINKTGIFSPLLDILNNS